MMRSLHIQNIRKHSPAIVKLRCSGDFESVDNVQFLNIEEDFQGRDVMTFKCPMCDETHKSLVFAN